MAKKPQAPKANWSNDQFRKLVHAKINDDKHVFASREEAENFFREFRNTLVPQTIILMQGKMGTGKSQTVKWLCNVEATSSPSYALHHSYRDGEKKYEHFDLDRLEGQDDLEFMGFWDIFSQTDAVIFIEWPERVDIAQLPLNWKVMTIQIAALDDGEKREVTISNYAALA